MNIANDGRLAHADIVATAMNRGISWRVYGHNREFRRPMFHRYPVNTGLSLLDAAVEHVTKGNPLLNALTRRRPR